MTNPVAFSKPRRIAIVGGGVSGLAAAFYLHFRAPDVDFVLFESSTRLGGVVQTLRVNDALIELGADNFATLIPDAFELSRDAGLEAMLIHPNQQHRLARVVSRGKIYPIPNGFSLMQPTRPSAILQTPVLSWSGKLRLLREYWIPARNEVSDESLEAFTVRRLGREAYDRLVEPIIGGIFTAQGSTLSMQAALPQFFEMEKKHGGLIRAQLAKQNRDSASARAAKQASGARYDQFVAHRDGMSEWIAGIARGIPADKIRLQRNVECIAPLPKSAVAPRDVGVDTGGQDLSSALASSTSSQRWIVTARDLSEGSSSPVEETVFDGVIVACPAQPAAKLLEPVSPVISGELKAIPYADSAVVAMLVDREEIDPKLICFGIVVPQVEKMNTLAISFTSEKYPERTPAGKILLRVFMGGAVRPDLMVKSDEELNELAWNDVQRLLRVKTLPSWSRVIRWVGAMPQYLVGHAERIATIEDALNAFPTLALAGNAYRGVGIPQCVRSGRQAAERLLQNFAN